MRDRVSPQVLAILNGLIEEKIGFHYDAAQRDILAEKATARALEAGFESMLDYYYYLRYDPDSAAELSLLVDTLVVGETFFFREAAQLELVNAELVAPAIAEGRRPRVWSAACASGEEILSIAMLLAERGALDRCDLVASDVSQRALARARSGRFGARSVRENPYPSVTRRWLARDGEQYVIARELVDAVTFQRINLLDEEAVRGVGLCDVIFCRNVLIYFRDETVARIVKILAERLRPGGALFVGISESLLRFSTDLVCDEKNGVFFYRKPGGS